MSTAIRCPHCGRLNEEHDEVRKPMARPRDGDVSLCWGCRLPSVFADGVFGLVQRKPTADEQREFDADPRIQQALAAMAYAPTPQEALKSTRGSS